MASRPPASTTGRRRRRDDVRDVTLCDARAWQDRGAPAAECPRSWPSGRPCGAVEKARGNAAARRLAATEAQATLALVLAAARDSGHLPPLRAGVVREVARRARRPRDEALHVDDLTGLPGSLLDVPGDKKPSPGTRVFLDMETSRRADISLPCPFSARSGRSLGMAITANGSCFPRSQKRDLGYPYLRLI